MMSRPILASLCVGMTLSSMFFYPLTASLQEGAYFLHWKSANTHEFLLAWLAVSILFGFGWWVSLRIPSLGVKLLVVIVTFILPFSSMGIHVIRQTGVANYLSDIDGLEQKIVIGCFLLFGLLASTVIFHRKAANLRSKVPAVLFATMIILSPISVLSLYTVVAAGFPVDGAKEKSPESQKDRHIKKTGEPARGNVYLFLFDELSYEFLYENNLVKKEYPNIGKLASSADNYHAAYSGDSATLEVVPNLLFSADKERIYAPRGNRLIYVAEDKRENALIPLQRESLLSMAEEKGYKICLWTWYHNFCGIIRSGDSECRSISMYNFADTAEGFSILNPIFTNLLIWPQSMPFGLLKRPVAVVHHRSTTEKILELCLRSASLPEPVFQFAHFPIPHNPFIFSAEGFSPPQNPFAVTREAYESQLKYVDRLVGVIVNELKANNKYDTSLIAVFSDHNFRRFSEGANKKKVPLIVKNVMQSKKRDIFSEESLSKIIKNAFSDVGNE